MCGKMERENRVGKGILAVTSEEEESVEIERGSGIAKRGRQELKINKPKLINLPPTGP